MRYTEPLTHTFVSLYISIQIHICRYTCIYFVVVAITVVFLVCSFVFILHEKIKSCQKIFIDFYQKYRLFFFLKGFSRNLLKSQTYTWDYAKKIQFLFLTFFCLSQYCQKALTVLRFSSRRKILFVESGAYYRCL